MSLAFSHQTSLPPQKKLKSQLRLMSQGTLKLEATTSLAQMGFTQSLLRDNSSKTFVSQGTKTKTMSCYDAVNTISDFHSKEEVSRAIDLADSVQNRKQVLDLVLKRRQQIKEIRDKFAWQKAAPTIKRLTTNYRNRIKKNHFSSNGNQFKKSLVALFSEESQQFQSERAPTTTLFRTETYSPSPDLLQSPMISPECKTEASFDFDLQKSGSIGVRVDTATNSIGRAKSFDGIGALGLYALGRDKELYNGDLDRIQEEIIGSLVLGNSRTAKAQESLMRQANSITTGRNTARYTFAGSKKDKNGTIQEIKAEEQKRKNKLATTTNSSAKAQFVNDLCRYLAKNEDNQEYQEVVYNASQPKASVIREIETKAKNKFQSFSDNKNILPCLSLESHRTPRAGSEAHATSPKGRSIRKFGEFSDMSLGLKNHPPSLPGRIKASQTIKEPLKTYDGIDESFASYTELQLDNLYRQTGKIHKTMKSIDDRLENTEKVNKSRKLEKVKTQKLQSLYRNTDEIMKLTNKKLVG